MTLAFRDLGLHTVSTWAVEHNVSLLASEHREIDYAGRPGFGP